MAKFKSVDFVTSSVSIRGGLLIEFENKDLCNEFLSLGATISTKNGRTFRFAPGLANECTVFMHLPLAPHNGNIPVAFRTAVIEWLKTNYPDAYNYKLLEDTTENPTPTENPIPTDNPENPVPAPKPENPVPGQNPENPIPLDKPENPVPGQNPENPIPVDQPENPVPEPVKSYLNLIKPENPAYVETKPRPNPETDFVPEPAKPVDKPVEPIEGPENKKFRFKNAYDGIKNRLSDFAQLYPIRWLMFVTRLFFKMPGRHPKTLGLLSTFLTGGALSLLSFSWAAILPCAMLTGLVISLGAHRRNVAYENAQLDAPFFFGEDDQAYQDGLAAGRGWFPYLKSCTQSSWLKAPFAYGAGLSSAEEEEERQENTQWEEEEYKRNYSIH